MQSEAVISGNEPLNWNELKDMSLQPGGFGSRRVHLWTRLLNANQVNEDLKPSLKEAAATEHQDERQIRLDTDRSFVLYPTANEQERTIHQNELHDLIVSVFRRRPLLSYFQGYHDIVSVIFLTLPRELQLVCLEQLSLQRVRDSMGSSLEPVLGLLHVLKRLLILADTEFAGLLARNSPLPYFALSNLLTLFSHNVPTLPLIQHVFDYLLCRPPIFAVYLSAAIVLSRKEEAVALEQAGDEGVIHSVFSALPDLFEEDEADTSLVNNSANNSGIPEDANHVSNSSDQTGESEDAQSSSQMAGDSFVESDHPTELSIPAHLPINESYAMSRTPASPTSSGDSDKESHSNELPAAISAELINTPQSPTAFGPAPVPDELPAVSQEPAQLSNPPSIHIPPSDIHSRPQTPSPVSTSRPRLSLSCLLRTADRLHETYPPTHPSIALNSIMGPQSVVFTWSENAENLPENDEAERIVLRPDLIVLPLQSLIEESSSKEGNVLENEDEKSVKGKRSEKRKRRKLRRPLPLAIRRKTMVASAVLVLGVAMAVYGTGGFQQVGLERHGTHREWKAFKHFVGAVVVGAAERLLDSVWG